MPACTVTHDPVARRRRAAASSSAAADLGGAEIPARYDLVGETRLGTVIGRTASRSA